MAAAIALLLIAGCAGDQRARRGDRVDVSSYPPEIQSAYRVFAVRCSRCHTLARPLNARISDPQHWIRYVTRMRRQPGSGINSGNAQIILRFLLYYHDPQRMAEPAPAERPSPPRTAPSRPASPAAPAPDASVVAPAPDSGSSQPPAASEPSADPTLPAPPGAESLGAPDDPDAPAGVPDRRSP